MKSFFDQFPVIYTDGSNSLKTGLMGWAAIVMHDGRVIKEISGSGEGANGKAELMALVKALEIIPLKGIATVYSDAEYVVLSMNKYRAKWERNGYIGANGKPIKHLDLMKQAHKLMDERQVTILHCKGHSGIEGNELADKLANRARVAAENLLKLCRSSA